MLSFSGLAPVEAIPRASETVTRWETLMGLETATSDLAWCQQADSKVQPTAYRALLAGPPLAHRVACE
jgi:hypothetical protein